MKSIESDNRESWGCTVMYRNAETRRNAEAIAYVAPLIGCDSISFCTMYPSIGSGLDWHEKMGQEYKCPGSSLLSSVLVLPPLLSISLSETH